MLGQIRHLFLYNLRFLPFQTDILVEDNAVIPVGLQKIMAKEILPFRQSVCLLLYNFPVLRPDRPRMTVDSVVLHFQTIILAGVLNHLVHDTVQTPNSIKL